MKSFPPTAKKLKKAREDGDIAKSQDLTRGIILTIGLAYIYFAFRNISPLLSFIEQGIEIVTQLKNNNIDNDSKLILELFREMCVLVLRTIAPLILLISLTAIMSNFLQVGFKITFKYFSPKFERFNPAKNLKNILGINEEKAEDKIFLGKIFYDFTRIATLITLLTIIGYFTITSHLPLFFSKLNANSISQELIFQFEIFTKMITSIFLYVASICIISGAIDFILERNKRRKRLRMDLEELKQELKESEGNPEIISMRKQLHREILLHDLKQNVRKAKILVLNK